VSKKKRSKKSKAAADKAKKDVEKPEGSETDERADGPDEAEGHAEPAAAAEAEEARPSDDESAPRGAEVPEDQDEGEDAESVEPEVEAAAEEVDQEEAAERESTAAEAPEEEEVAGVGDMAGAMGEFDYDLAGAGFDLDLDTIAAEAAAANAAAAAGPSRARRQIPVSPATLKATAPVGVALLASLLLQLIITFGVDESSYVYRLFRPPGGSGMSLIPWLIVFLLFWTLVDLLLKFLDGRENERDLARGEIRRIPTLVADEPTPMLQRRILALDGADRPVARRLLWLLYYLERNADAQRTHELMRHQSDLDTDTAAAGYRTVKLFIWAMPILGFVGTVLGISLAVGGFSEFLTTNLDIDDVTQVTNELGNVASGLSFAFDTTLLGLLAGLIANVASSNVQKRDERFFTRLE
jgi:biopolymer transport protein ExbB/TolQ